MSRGKIISLEHLVQTRSEQVEQMTNGIRGAGPLWTAKMRAAVRGGKCLIGQRPEDQPDSD